MAEGNRRLHHSRRVFLLGAGASGFLTACGGSDDSPSPTATSSAATSSPPPGTPSITATAPAATATSAPATQPPATQPPATEQPTQPPPTQPSATRLAPVGFPIGVETATGLVRGEVGSRAIAWGEGPAALAYSRDDQPSSDPVRANSAGWNARVHLEYESWPAVDWYLPVGTPVYSTLAGTATLYLVTIANPFDVYGVSREPYLGNPDRSRAPITPFPGPGGGMGVLVRVRNSAYRADFGHFDLAPTLANVPSGAFHSGVDPSSLAAQFAELRGYLDWTAVASWEVDRGDLIGYTGDTGYSEAPHLHYAIARADGSALCPTSEPGVANGGWLFLSEDP